jgi:hypothetical protein
MYLVPKKNKEQGIRTKFKRPQCNMGCAFFTPNCTLEDTGKMRLWMYGINSRVQILLTHFDAMCNRRKVTA